MIYSGGAGVQGAVVAVGCQVDRFLIMVAVRELVQEGHGERALRWVLLHGALPTC